MAVRGRPPKEQARDTRQALIDAGLELFARNGFFGTSLREIAQAVGVRESALYNHFESKEALFYAIVKEGEASRRGDLARMLPTKITDPRATLLELGHAFIARASTLRESKLFRIMMSDGMRLSLEGKVNFFDRTSGGARPIFRVIEQLVREGHLAHGDPEFLTMEFTSAFWTWRHFHALQPEHPIVTNPRAFLEAHVDHFLHGAATRGGKGRRGPGV